MNKCLLAVLLLAACGQETAAKFDPDASQEPADGSAVPDASGRPDSGQGAVDAGSIPPDAGAIPPDAGPSCTSCVCPGTWSITAAFVQSESTCPSFISAPTGTVLKGMATLAMTSGGQLSWSGGNVCTAAGDWPPVSGCEYYVQAAESSCHDFETSGTEPNGDQYSTTGTFTWDLTFSGSSASGTGTATITIQDLTMGQSTMCVLGATLTASLL